jgi:3-methyladenine DNA glycosylase/8-oxoguanine DNA glycosylase
VSGDIALPVRGPFRLPAVAVSHGWFQTAPFAWDPGEECLRRVEVLEGRAVTLTIHGEPGGVRVAATRSLSPAERRAARSRVGRMLQLHADLDGFADAARRVDPGLADDLVAYGAGRLLAGGSLYEDVVKAICATNTTWRQAVACINRVAALGRAGAFPEPAAILRAG